MAEKYVALQANLPRPSDSMTAVAAQVTDLTGLQNSKNLSTKDLFHPALFLTDESVINRTGNQQDYGRMESPPRIGIPPRRNGYWAEQKSKNPSEPDWSLIFGAPKDSECPVQESAKVEPVRALPIGQSQTHKLATVGAGLRNLGNSCFMNAVLQCFIHTVPFVSSILSDLQGNCFKGFCPLCIFRELVSDSFTTKSTAVLPWIMFWNLTEFSKSFKTHQQEDAHEFLQCFLNTFESCYGENGGHSQSENLVKQVFRGETISKLKCCKCGHPSDTQESSLDLSLAIENVDDLKTAIQSFMKVEKIETVDCECCKEKEPAERKLSFTKVPSVATFHLKRFRHDGSSVQKIDKHVTFPLDLDLLPFTASGKTTDEELKYMLLAVVVHQGISMSSGHYYCFIRLAPNMWYRFDDSNVTQIQEKFVLSQQAYILFYVKEGTPWFSSFIETLPKKQLLLHDTDTWSSPPDSVTNSSLANDAIVVSNPNDLQDTAVSTCLADSLNETSLVPVAVCTIQLDQPPCKRSLEKLIDDTEPIVDSILASLRADSRSRKKSRNDDL